MFTKSKAFLVELVRVRSYFFYFLLVAQRQSKPLYFKEVTE